MTTKSVRQVIILTANLPEDVIATTFRARRWLAVNSRCCSGEVIWASKI